MLRKIILLIFTVFFVSGCFKKDNAHLTLHFWAMGAEGETVQYLIPEFEEENPGVKVKVQMIPWTAAQEKLITAFASDNLPDVLQLGNTWIPQFVSLNALHPLDVFLQSSLQIDAENYFSGIWQTNEINEKIFGIPWYIDTRVLFYRTDVLAKAGFKNPPRTWDELLWQCRMIKKKLGNSKFAIFFPTNEWNIFVIFALQNKANLLKENNSYGNFESTELKEAFAFLMKFYDEGLTPLSLSEVTNIHQAFAQGFVNMYISGPWNVYEFKKWMKGNLADKWMTAPLPGKNQYPGVSLAGGSSLVIPRQSKKKKIAWKFIEYLSRPQVQLKFYKLLNDLPAIKKAWQDSILLNDKYMKAFYQQFQFVKPTPKVPEWEHIAYAKIQQYAEQVARKAMTIDQALQCLDNDVNRILKKRRWMLKKNFGSVK